ncbi:alpha/beta hydrolase [Virgibacillus siamensis]|uniref:alpha/beta hydrolase n=1 Tax=Virgibacillus siamensis TaxID=480071 RepID=UPI0009867BE9|nr:alpha/beta hydrolase [Virgibacillus siamensis]
MITISNGIIYDYYVEKRGAGEPVIFLPAAGFYGNEGLNIADFLQNDFETHMMDLPGGRSLGIQARQITSLDMAKWLKGYMDQQQMNKVNLIGHSMGGLLALTFAVHYPERVNKLVLLDQAHKPFPRIPKREFGLFAYAIPYLNIGAVLLGKPFLKLLEPLFSDKDSNVDIDTAVKRFCETIAIKENAYIRKAHEQSVSFTLDTLNLYFGYYRINQPKLLAENTVPTFLAYATFKGVNEQENAYTCRHLRELQHKKSLPITYRPVEGGHYVHWSDDPTLLPEIKLFLKGRME